MSTEETDNSGVIVDISGNALKNQRIIQMENRKQAMVELIMRQTDYTEEITLQKLTEWKNNYLYVIKEYMNPNFQVKEEEWKQGRTSKPNEPHPMISPLLPR